MPRAASSCARSSGLDTSRPSADAEEVTYEYRVDVLALLIRHGIRPGPHTRPEVARAYVNDLYRYELRILRDRMLRGDFPRTEYAARVDQLRRQYPVLAWRAHEWVDSHTPNS